MEWAKMDDRSIRLFGSVSVRPRRFANSVDNSVENWRHTKRSTKYAKGAGNEREVKSIIERARDGKKAVEIDPWLADTSSRCIISGEATMRAKYRDSEKED